MRLLVAAAAVLILLAVPAALFFLSSSPSVEFKPALKSVGPDTPVTLEALSKYGIRRASLILEQGAARDTAAYSEPAVRWTFWRHAKPAPQTLAFKIHADPKKGFKTGPAKLTAEVEANDLRGQISRKAIDITVNLEPPHVVADGAQHYINQGGAELVTFNITGYWTEAGVRVGPYTFRSFPMPGQNDPNSRFALFGYPWDVPVDTAPVVFAKNDAGQEAMTTFWHKIFPKKFRQRDLELTSQFLQKAIMELDPNGTGDLLPRFLKINGEMRRANNAAMAALREKTEPQVLWQGPFLQLSNSKVEAFFADVRSYMFEGKKVDQQTHLGFDLSVTANIPVVAANRGKVVWADRLGIYGNCVVLDHGYGLQSIYAHLSSISVKPGDMVNQKDVLGKSGSTGLAGGDHLHYSMQIDGVQVNAVEWWDAHWIQDRILSKLPARPAAQ